MVQTRHALSPNNETRHALPPNNETRHALSLHQKKSFSLQKRIAVVGGWIKVFFDCAC